MIKTQLTTDKDEVGAVYWLNTVTGELRRYEGLLKPSKLNAKTKAGEGGKRRLRLPMISRRLRTLQTHRGCRLRRLLLRTCTSRRAHEAASSGAEGRGT